MTRVTLSTEEERTMQKRKLGKSNLEVSALGMTSPTLEHVSGAGVAVTQRKIAQ